MKIEDVEMKLHPRPSSPLTKYNPGTSQRPLWYWYTYLRRDAEVQIVTNKVASDNNGYPTKSIVGRPPSYLARAVACNLYRQTCKVYIYLCVRAMWCGGCGTPVSRHTRTPTPALSPGATPARVPPVIGQVADWHRARWLSHWQVRDCDIQRYLNQMMNLRLSC